MSVVESQSVPLELRLDTLSHLFDPLPSRDLVKSLRISFSAGPGNRAALIVRKYVAMQRRHGVRVRSEEADMGAAFALKGLTKIYGEGACLAPVEIGEGGDHYLAIARGLSPGDVVIVFPGDALRDGARVRARARAR